MRLPGACLPGVPRDRIRFSSDTILLSKGTATKLPRPGSETTLQTGLHLLREDNRRAEGDIVTRR